MEKNNIAELLKDCPSGMELNCLMYEDVYFDYVDTLNIIHCYIQHKAHKTYLMFNQHGTPDDDIKSKCVIFPKGKTTWEGFVPPYKFKDGDVAITYMGDIHLCRTEDSSYCACRMPYARLPRFDSTITTGVKFIRLATEEEKKKFFDIIKDKGYKWNEDTKTLEMLIQPKFKVGDKVVKKDNPTECWYVQGVDTNCNLDYFYHIVAKGKIANLHFKEQDDWELVPNKFDINTLVPFESKVLIRNGDRDIWRPAIFGGYKKNENNEIEYYYALGGTCWRNCIPYEGNEHLRGTTDDCKEFYKT